MKKLKSCIVRMMHSCPECRDDDVMLAFAVWEQEGLVLTPEQHKSLVSLSKPGSVVRIRARIQNTEGRLRSARRN